MLKVISGFLQTHPPLVGFLLSALIFGTSYQHFDVGDTGGALFWQGLAVLILVLFAINAAFSGMWGGFLLLLVTAWVELLLIARLRRSSESK
jgi:hypothetical protein